MKVFTLCIFICSINRIHASPYDLGQQVDYDETVPDGALDEIAFSGFDLGEDTYTDSMTQNEPVIIAGNEPTFNGNGVTFGGRSSPEMQQQPSSNPAPVPKIPAPQSPKKVPQNPTPEKDQNPPPASNPNSAKGNQCSVFDVKFSIPQLNFPSPDFPRQEHRNTITGTATQPASKIAIQEK